MLRPVRASTGGLVSQRPLRSLTASGRALLTGE